MACGQAALGLGPTTSGFHPFTERACSQAQPWWSPAAQNQDWAEMSLGCRKNVKGIMLRALGSEPEEREDVQISMGNYSSAQ